MWWIKGARTVWTGFFSVMKVGINTDKGLIERDVVKVRDSVGVLLINEDTKCAIMVKQYRPGPLASDLNIGKYAVLEIPAGVIDDGETPKQAASREIIEETGYDAHLVDLGAYWLAPGTSTEMCHLFLGYTCNSDKVGDGGGLASENEEIEIVEEPLAGLSPRNDTLDAKTALAIALVRLRYPNLFEYPEKPKS